MYGIGKGFILKFLLKQGGKTNLSMEKFQGYRWNQISNHLKFIKIDFSSLVGL